MGYKTYTCPIAKSCGGCEWLAVPYPIQLKRKQAQVMQPKPEPVKIEKAVMTSELIGTPRLPLQGSHALCARQEGPHPLGLLRCGDAPHRALRELLGGA